MDAIIAVDPSAAAAGVLQSPLKYDMFRREGSWRSGVLQHTTYTAPFLLVQ